MLVQAEVRRESLLRSVPDARSFGHGKSCCWGDVFGASLRLTERRLTIQNLRLLLAGCHRRRLGLDLCLGLNRACFRSHSFIFDRGCRLVFAGRYHACTHDADEVRAVTGRRDFSCPPSVGDQLRILLEIRRLSGSHVARDSGPRRPSRGSLPFESPSVRLNRGCNPNGFLFSGLEEDKISDVLVQVGVDVRRRHEWAIIAHILAIIQRWLIVVYDFYHALLTLAEHGI